MTRPIPAPTPGHRPQVPRRGLLLGAGAAALTALSGCAAAPPRPLTAEGRYCVANGKASRRVLTCTDAPVPNDASDALRFEPQRERFTVYVVRKRWGDTAHAVRVLVDDELAAMTVPASFLRLRLAPGSHRFVSDWAGERAETTLTGAAGSVQYLELVAPFWRWGRVYGWQTGRADEAQALAQASRLVADLSASR